MISLPSPPTKTVRTKVLEYPGVAGLVCQVVDSIVLCETSGVSHRLCQQVPSSYFSPGNPPPSPPPSHLSTAQTPPPPPRARPPPLPLWRDRFPYMSCEIICCEVPEILSAIAKDNNGGENADSCPLRKLFSLLDSAEDIDAHRAGYLEKASERTSNQASFFFFLVTYGSSMYDVFFSAPFVACWPCLALPLPYLALPCVALPTLGAARPAPHFTCHTVVVFFVSADSAGWYLCRAYFFTAVYSCLTLIIRVYVAVSWGYVLHTYIRALQYHMYFTVLNLSLSYVFCLVLY